jgi:hypothetical protein
MNTVLHIVLNSKRSEECIYLHRVRHRSQWTFYITSEYFVCNFITVLFFICSTMHSIYSEYGMICTGMLNTNYILSLQIFFREYFTYVNLNGCCPINKSVFFDLQRSSWCYQLHCVYQYVYEIQFIKQSVQIHLMFNVIINYIAGPIIRLK